MRTLLPAMLTVALVACNADNITAVPEPVAPVATDVWAGGFVKLHSHAFTSPDTLPVVLLAGDTLPVNLTDTFVVSVAIPDTASGPLTLSVLSAAASDTQTVTVNAHGFAQQYPGPELTGGLPQRTMDGYVLALDTTGTVLLNPEAGNAQSLLPQSPQPMICTQTLTPGLSLVPDVVLGSATFGNGCKYYAWSFAGSAPAIVDSAPVGEGFAVAYVGPNRWIINTKHETWAMTDTSSTSLGYLEEPNEFVADGAEQFLVPTFSSTSDTAGIPVYSTTTSEIAYRISGQTHIGGAGFSSDGDTLFVDGPELLALDAATGRVLMRAPSDGFDWSYMILEPGSPWIYLVPDTPIDVPGSFSGVAGFAVIDRRTLETVAHIAVPLSAPEPYKFDDITFPALGANNKLYVVDIHAWRSGAGPTRIYEFDLLP